MELWRVLFNARRKGLADREDDEKYLKEVLRTTTNRKDFIKITGILGIRGTYFSVPTLMALDHGPDKARQIAVKEALLSLVMRMPPDSPPMIWESFNESWWLSKWTAPAENFVSFVACIGQIQDPESYLVPEAMDKTAAQLLKYIQVDFSPFTSFGELRKTLSDEQIVSRLSALNSFVDQDMLIRSITSENEVSIGESSQVEENIQLMRCDYLLTCLNLPGIFEENLYVLRTLARLNYNNGKVYDL